MTKYQRQPQMSENEEAVKGCFERMFTFEFYIRYLEMNQSQDLQEIQSLNEVVTKEFIDFYKTHNLSGIEFQIPGDTQNQLPTPLDIDSLIAWALDKFQDPPITTEDLPKKIDLSALFFPEYVRNFLSTQILPLKKQVKPSQQQLAYRFYDLTHPNDINAVFHWWANHIDFQSVEKKEVRTDISMKIEEPKKNDDGSYPPHIVRTAPNFLSPSVLFIKEDRYCVYSTNSHSIKIDDQELSNSTVLRIRFDKDIQDIHEVLDFFKEYLRFENSNWHSEQIKSESPVGVDLLSCKKATDIPLFEQSDRYAKTISRYDSITKNLLGLMCFDEVKNIKKNPEKNINKDKDKEYIIIREAAKIVSQRIYSITNVTVEFDNVEANYNSVLDKINVIDKVVKLKQNRLKYGETYDFPKKSKRSTNRKQGA